MKLFSTMTALCLISAAYPAGALEIGAGVGGVSAGVSVGGGGVSASVGDTSVSVGSGGGSVSAGADVGVDAGVAADTPIGGARAGLCLDGSANAAAGGGGASGGLGVSGCVSSSAALLPGSTNGGTGGNGGPGTGSGGGGDDDRTVLKNPKKRVFVGQTVYGSDGVPLGQVVDIRQGRTSPGCPALGVRPHEALDIRYERVWLEMASCRQRSGDIRIGMTSSDFVASF